MISSRGPPSYSGHPTAYLKGYETGKTLEGHGIKVFRANGEDLDNLWTGVTEVLAHPGPAALISKRVMCPGIEGLEGEPHGHDVIPVDKAIKCAWSTSLVRLLEPDV